MTWVGRRRSVWFVAVLFAMACGRLPNGAADVSPTPSSDTSPSASPSSSASPSPSPSSSPAQWPVYTDADYHFDISYPSGFTFLKEGGSPGTGMLQAYRAVDPAYLNTYPPGQVEIAIYTKDADSLAAWVTKHSGPAGSNDLTRYWSPVTNQAPVALASQSGLAFDWVPDQGGGPIHAEVAFLGTTYVFLIQWWASEPSYEATVTDNYARMVASLEL